MGSFSEGVLSFSFHKDTPDYVLAAFSALAGPVAPEAHRCLHRSSLFDTSDRIYVQHLAGRAAVITPKTHSMQEAVAIMTGVMTVPEEEEALL